MDSIDVEGIPTLDLLHVLRMVCMGFCRPEFPSWVEQEFTINLSGLMCILSLYHNNKQLKKINPELKCSWYVGDVIDNNYNIWGGGGNPSYYISLSLLVKIQGFQQVETFSFVLVWWNIYEALPYFAQNCEFWPVLLMLWWLDTWLGLLNYHIL